MANSWCNPQQGLLTLMTLENWMVTKMLSSNLKELVINKDTRKHVPANQYNIVAFHMIKFWKYDCMDFSNKIWYLGFTSQHTVYVFGDIPAKVTKWTIFCEMLYFLQSHAEWFNFKNFTHAVSVYWSSYGGTFSDPYLSCVCMQIYVCIADNATLL